MVNRVWLRAGRMKEHGLYCCCRRCNSSAWGHDGLRLAHTPMNCIAPAWLDRPQIPIRDSWRHHR